MKNFWSMLIVLLELMCLDKCRFHSCKTLCWNMSLVLVDLARRQMANGNCQEKKIGTGKHIATFTWSFSCVCTMCLQYSQTRYFLDIVDFHDTLFQEFFLVLNPNTQCFIFYVMQWVVNSLAAYGVKHLLLFILNEALLISSVLTVL